MRKSSWLLFLSRRLNHQDVRDVCKIFLLLCVIGLVVSFVTAARQQGQTIFGEALGADFPQFYIAGTIANQVGAAAIYDRQLQTQLYFRLFPLAEPDTFLPYVHAPFFVVPFPLLARLPYPWAFACWLLLSLGVYVAGFTMLWRTFKGVPEAAYRTGLFVAITFMPFMMECLSGGQTSAIGFFFLALALTLERRGQFIASGLALALLAYKPTLLLLIGPMLMVTRRWRTLVGLSLGVGILGLLSYALVGGAGLKGWTDLMAFISQASLSQVTGLRTWKYVDANSFARTLWGGQPALRWLTVGAVLLLVVPQLLRAWWRVDEASETQRQTGWALALAWLPVLNLYVGFYDATLMALSVMLVTAWHYQQAQELPQHYALLLLVLYITPWFSQQLAQTFGFQLFTVILLLWGHYVLRLVRAVPVPKRGPALAFSTLP